MYQEVLKDKHLCKPKDSNPNQSLLTFNTQKSWLCFITFEHVSQLLAGNKSLVFGKRFYKFHKFKCHFDKQKMKNVNFKQTLLWSLLIKRFCKYLSSLHDFKSNNCQILLKRQHPYKTFGRIWEIRFFAFLPRVRWEDWQHSDFLESWSQQLVSVA